ncbi:hypothetical protein FB45DRAFT_877208 [Roridomyces roridus]|uniref:Uncharacterized protein n=1 Tax=Roridomyces roridus TaxID=1738132 RepID=A0AAD7F891_9AGAR|nr:hypothetical protein FB45DRAFT_877208 [Roridomyces roridus]
MHRKPRGGCDNNGRRSRTGGRAKLGKEMKEGKKELLTAAGVFPNAGINMVMCTPAMEMPATHDLGNRLVSLIGTYTAPQATRPASALIRLVSAQACKQRKIEICGSAFLEEIASAEVSEMMYTVAVAAGWCVKRLLSNVDSSHRVVLPLQFRIQEENDPEGYFAD